MNWTNHLECNECWVVSISFIHILGGGSVVVDSLSIDAFTVCENFVFGPLFCNAVLSVHRNTVLISPRRKRREGWLLYYKLSSCSCVAGSVLSVSLLHGEGWSAVYDYGISWSYVLAFKKFIM